MTSSDSNKRKEFLDFRIGIIGAVKILCECFFFFFLGYTHQISASHDEIF